jgi:hypothetical protein
MTAAASPPGAMEDTRPNVLQAYRLLETMHRKKRFEDLFDEQLDLTASSSSWRLGGLEPKKIQTIGVDGGRRLAKANWRRL